MVLDVWRLVSYAPPFLAQFFYFEAVDLVRRIILTGALLVISDNIIFPLIEKALGRDIPTSAELRQMMEQERQNPKQVHNVKEADKDALPETSLGASVIPLNPIDDVLVK